MSDEEMAKWDTAFKVRSDVNGVLETARADKRIGKSLEAHVALTAVDAAAAEAVKADSPAASAAPAAETTTASDLNGKRVLVLCQGGGTSGLLANALAKAAKERGINHAPAAEAYGNHVDMLPD